MAASATSRISPAHAGYHKPQGPAANHADASNPFAALLESTTPKAKPTDDKQADKQADKTDTAAAADPQDSKSGVTQDTSAAAVKPAKDDKADAKVADKDTDKADDAKNDDVLAAADVPPPPAPSPAPQPVALTLNMAVTPPANDDTGSDAEENDTAAAPIAATSGAAQAPAPKPGAQADTDTDKAKATDTKAAAQTDTAKPDASKTDAAKPVTHKMTAQAAKDSKPDTAPADAAKPETVQVAAADAPAPRPATTPTNAAPQDVGAVQTASAPQATAAAPGLAQQVQVTAQATTTPNIHALAVEISAKTQSGAKQFDIRLDPPELGRVEVRLSIDENGKASAHLSADKPQTLDLLQKDSTSLTRALREAGLDVSQDGLNFSLRQQNGQGGFAGDNSGRGASRGAATLQASKIVETTGASAATRVSADGRLDIKV